MGTAGQKQWRAHQLSPPHAGPHPQRRRNQLARQRQHRRHRLPAAEPAAVPVPRRRPDTHARRGHRRPDTRPAARPAAAEPCTADRTSAAGPSPQRVVRAGPARTARPATRPLVFTGGRLGAGRSGRPSAAAASWRRVSRALRDRRLHRLLRVHEPRAQHLPPVPAGSGVPAEFCAPADCVPRPRVVHRAQRSAPAQAARPNAPQPGRATAVRPLAQARLRGRAGHLHRARQSARRRHFPGRRRGSHGRPVHPQRLVGARRAGVRIATAWAVSEQELLLERGALGGDAGRPGAVSRAACAARGRCTRAATLPALGTERRTGRVRHPPGDALEHTGHARRRAARTHHQPRPLRA